MKILFLVGSIALLSGCAGYDSVACYESAKEKALDSGMTISLIPGEKYRFIAVGENKAAYIETMSHSSCKITQFFTIDVN